MDMLQQNDDYTKFLFERFDSIVDASLSIHDTSYGGFKYKITVRIDMPKDMYNRIYNKDMGTIVLDISNYLFRKLNGLMPYGPKIVDDKRISKGIKYIQIRFLFDDDKAAEALGMPGKWINFKDGPHFVEEFGAYVNLIRKGE